METHLSLFPSAAWPRSFLYFIKSLDKLNDSGVGSFTMSALCDVYVLGSGVHANMCSEVSKRFQFCHTFSFFYNAKPFRKLIKRKDSCIEVPG